jgi:phosphatidate cytidylyltransferase
MAAIVLGILVVSTIVVEVMKRVKPQKDFRELASRIYSWWVMAAVFFAAVAVDHRLSIIFFAFLSFWGLKEFMTLLKTRPADHKALVFAFLSVVVQYYWVYDRWYGMFIIFIPVYMFLLIPARLTLSGETAGFVASASQIQWGLMAFVFGISHMAFLLNLNIIGPPEVDGRSLLLFLVFVVEMSDVLQYVWGKMLGRHKILPTVSPNKTWEGFLGGVASTVLLSLTIRFLTPFTVPETLLVALIICIAGFLGGAVMSSVKRDFGVKDFGAVIPGHGGMLDRVDSLCWAAPVFFHYVRYFHEP